MSRPTTSSSLTRREYFLLALLLLGLLSLSAVGYGSRESPSFIEKIVHTYTSKFHTHSQGVFIPTLDSERWRTRVTWSTNEDVPSTTIVAHVPGWTIFDNLFLLNGTVFVVTNDPESIPDRNSITSVGIEITNGPEAVTSRLPTDSEFHVITIDEARELFGTTANLIDGATWIVNDPPQFITHYYHWSAELFFGFWRVYSSLDPSISQDGSSSLPALRRIWFSHADDDHWRDYASMNQWVLRTVFPSVTAEYSPDWLDRAAMRRPLLLDRVIFTDRSAAMNGEEFLRTGRIASEAFALPGSAHWWNPVRTTITKFSGLDADLDPASNPVITYISRQEWGRRSLIPEDHERLVEALYRLRDQHGVEVNVVSMDRLSHEEQFRLAARTTILMGVHGNGLTSLVWMKPTPKSTVIEFFYPGGFAHDYEYTSRALGMVHYGVWNDKTFTYPDVPPVNYPEGFQGNSIPLNGETVAKVCLERLQLPVS